MPFLVKFLPVLSKRLFRHRMHRVRRQFGQWTEHETVFKHVATWNSEPGFIDYALVVEQEIDVERSRGKLRAAADAPCPVVYGIDGGTDFLGPVVRIQTDDKIQEIGPVETDRPVAVDGRDLQCSVAPAQFLDTKPQVGLRVDVAAEPQIDSWHLLSVLFRPRAALDYDANLPGAADRPRLVNPNFHPGDIELIEHDGGYIFRKGLHQLVA